MTGSNGIWPREGRRARRGGGGGGAGAGAGRAGRGEADQEEEEPRGGERQRQRHRDGLRRRGLPRRRRPRHGRLGCSSLSLFFFSLSVLFFCFEKWAELAVGTWELGALVHSDIIGDNDMWAHSLVGPRCQLLGFWSAMPPSREGTKGTSIV